MGWMNVIGELMIGSWRIQTSDWLTDIYLLFICTLINNNVTN